MYEDWKGLLLVVAMIGSLLAWRVEARAHCINVSLLVCNQNLVWVVHGSFDIAGKLLMQGFATLILIASWYFAAPFFTLIQVSLL